MLWLLAVKKKKHLHLHQLQQLKRQQHLQQLQQQKLQQLQQHQLLMLSQLTRLLQHQQLTLSQLTQHQQNNQLIIEKADLRVGFFYACTVCTAHRQVMAIQSKPSSWHAIMTSPGCASSAPHSAARANSGVLFFKLR